MFVCTRCGCLDLCLGLRLVEPSSLSVHVLLLFLFCLVCLGTEYYNVAQTTFEFTVQLRFPQVRDSPTSGSRVLGLQPFITNLAF